MLTQDKNGIWASDTKPKDISFPDSGYSDCMSIEDKSFWFNHRHKIIELMISKFKFNHNLADIGGGNGFNLFKLEKNYLNNNCFLVEPGYQGCLNAKLRGAKHVYNTVFQDLDFKKLNIDGACLFDVIEHVEDDLSFMQELRDKLPKGSLIYITVPAYNWLWSDVDELSGHFRRHTIKSIKKLAEKSGFKCVWASYFFAYVPIPLFLSRGLKYRLGKKRSFEDCGEAELSNHQMGKLASMILNTLGGIEYFLIKIGLKLPFGGSVVAVLKV